MPSPPTSSRPSYTSPPHSYRGASSSRSAAAPSPPESINDGHSRSQAEQSVSFEMTHSVPPTMDPPSGFRFDLPLPQERDTAGSPVDDHWDEPQAPQARNVALTQFTEDTYIKKPLGTWDVAALIMNKMIGAGFFTTPGTVLLLTGSKNMSLVLWFIGGIYSMVSFSIYLEYGLNFKFNGGDLIYIDEVWPVPELLSTVLFSGFFICLGNTAGNSIAFAKHALAAASPNVHIATEFDHRLVSLIAVGILSIVCLLHYFSSGFGLFLNRFLAYYKIGLLCTVFIAGVAARHNTNSGLHDWSQMERNHSSSDTLSAMIYVLYSYQGWENANYVAGEIKADKPTLLRGGFLAVTITMILYILGTVGYFLACNFATITSQDSDLGMAYFFASQAFGGHTTGFKICVALSAVGNLVAVVFTSSKVKQCIARQRIIPFYNFFGDDDKNFGTPRGALVLHWIFTVMLIAATPRTADGYSFIIGMFTYGHLIVGVFIGLGILFKLKKRMTQFKGLEAWDFRFLTWPWIRRGIATLFVSVNILILVVGARPHKGGTIPRFWWPVVMLCIVSVSAAYWFVLWSLQDKRFGSKVLAIDVKVMHGDSLGVDSDYQAMLKDARKDGSNRRTVYEVHDGSVWEWLKPKGVVAVNWFYRYLW